MDKVKTIGAWVGSAVLGVLIFATVVHYSSTMFTGSKPVKLTASIASAQVGQQFTVVAETSSETVRWRTFPHDAAYVYADAAKKTLVVTPKGGDLTLTAFTRTGDYEDLVVPVRGFGPSPVPPSPPGPNPPPFPGPAPLSELVTKFRDALAKDSAAKNGTKELASLLASVYLDSASLLAKEDVRTVGDFYKELFGQSISKGIPRRPYLSYVRDVIENYVGDYEGEAQLTPAIKAEFSTKLSIVGQSLKEATK